MSKTEPSESDRHALTQFLPVFHTNAAVLLAVANSLSQTNALVSQTQRVRLLEALAAAGVTELSKEGSQAVLQLLNDAGGSVQSAAVRAVGALRVPRAEKPLASLAHDQMQPASLRLEALRELVRRRPGLEAGEFEFLAEQLASSNGFSARLAAAEILLNTKLQPLEMQEFLKAVRQDAVTSPAMVLAAIGRNNLYAACASDLLDYLAASLDAGWSLPVEELAKVQASIPQANRAQASRLIARLADNAARQRQKLDELKPLLKGGDRTRGERIFFEKAQCTTCHRIWENGGRGGPDLTTIGAIRSGRDLIESIVIPSASIAQGYDTLIVTTKDDETYTGIRAGSKEDPLVLRLGSGAEVILHQDQIALIERSKVSLMPGGLLNNLTPDEIRDLFAYLQHLK